MHRLRTRLIAVFLLATLAPLALTIWLVRSLIDLFSSPARREQRLWVLETSPFRLDTLK